MQGPSPRRLAKRCERIRRRDPMTLASEGFDAVLAEARLAPNDIAYIATTGEDTALLTGGLALDSGLLAAIREEMVNEKVTFDAISHPDSIYAGAIGGSLWGAFRYEKLNRLEARAAA